MSIQLGITARDKLSGFTGVVYCRCEMYNGCIQYGLQPKVASDKMTEHPVGKTFDEQQLEVVDATPVIETPDEPKCPYILGDIVVDKVSGLLGTVTERIMFMNGCMYLNVSSNRFSDNGKIIEVFIPYQRADSAATKQPEATKPGQGAKRPGGPTRDAPAIR